MLSMMCQTVALSTDLLKRDTDAWRRSDGEVSTPKSTTCGVGLTPPRATCKSTGTTMLSRLVLTCTYPCRYEKKEKKRKRSERMGEPCHPAIPSDASTRKTSADFIVDSLHIVVAVGRGSFSTEKQPSTVSLTIGAMICYRDHNPLSSFPLCIFPAQARWDLSSVATRSLYFVTLTLTMSDILLCLKRSQRG